jgi:predicted nucleotidyltransferase
MTSGRIDERALAAAAELFRSMGARRVFVFGSAVKGRLRPESDVDLAVEGLPPAVYFKAVSKATDILDRPVDLVDLDDRTPIVNYLLASGELVSVE